MWSEDEDVHAALRGDVMADATAEVNWARIITGAGVLAVVAIFAISSVIYFTPV